jgi:hypothetical protein
MGHRIFPLLWLCAFHFGMFSFCRGQGEPQPVQLEPPPVVPALQEPVHVPAVATLLDGTEINLRLAAPVKIKEVKVGDKVSFVLYHDLYYRDVLLAKVGEAVEAEIVDAVKARWASRGSKLAIDITGLKLLNGQTLPLRGYSLHSGGVGNAPRVADMAITTGSDIVCPMCKNLFAPASVIFFLASGSNQDVKEDSGAPSYVDGNFALDLLSFRPFQPKDTSEKGTVRVVRGHYGWPYKRDLYCNGVPLVHLNADHRFELKVDPGYYRFAINPRSTPVQVYVAPGTNTNLIATYDEISQMEEKDVNVNSRDVVLKPFGKPKSAGDLLKQAKAVDRADIYSASCSPLSEVFDVAAPPDAVPVPSKPSAPAETANPQPN